MDIQTILNDTGMDLGVKRIDGAGVVFIDHPYDLEADRQLANQLLKRLSDITRETGYRFSISRREGVE